MDPFKHTLLLVQVQRFFFSTLDSEGKERVGGNNIFCKKIFE